MKPDANAFISGGFFLTMPVGRPQFLTTLVPDLILTLSNCFAEIAPDDWADEGYNYEDQERIEEALKFGIPASAVPSLVAQFTQAVRSNHLTNFFPSLSLAQEFYHHCTNKERVALIGIGLEPSLIPSVLAQLKDDVNQGYGLIERVNEKEPLEPGGEILGYEPLGFEGTKFHSWLCHNAPEDAYQKFGIRPNSHGFIDSLADAVRVTENLKATGAEPAIWEPWLIVQYQNAVESSSTP
jgi:hypothetical protein